MIEAHGELVQARTMVIRATTPIAARMSTATRPRESSALWRVGAFSHQRVPPTADYLWDNRDRCPARLCVFQYTIEGVLTYRDREGDHEVPPGHALLFTFGEASRYWLPPGPRRTTDESFDTSTYEHGGVELAA